MGVALSAGTLGSEAGQSIVDLSYVANGSQRPIIWGHGAGGSSTSLYADPTIAVVMNAVASRFPGVSHLLGGADTWGNDASIVKVTDSKTYAQGALGGKSGKVFLCGVSMGALTLLNWAKANPTLVAAFVGILPITNLVWIHDTGGFKAATEAAYGTGAVASFVGNSTITAHDPIQTPASFAGFPMKLYYSNNDAIARPTDVTGFASAVNGAGGNCTTVNMGNSSQVIGPGHGLENIDPNDVVSFLGQYA